MQRDQKPKYMLVADELRARIQRGTYGPGEHLPARRLLMADFSASLATIDRAIDVLHDEGLVDTYHGVGSVVRPESERKPDRLADLESRVARLEAVVERHGLQLDE